MRRWIQMVRSKTDNQRGCSVRLLTGCQWIWLIFLYVIIIVALGSMIPRAFFAILLLPFVIYAIYQLAGRDKLMPERFPYRTAWWGIFFIGTIVMIVMVYSVRGELSWDWGKDM